MTKQLLDYFREIVADYDACIAAGHDPKYGSPIRATREVVEAMRTAAEPAVTKQHRVLREWLQPGVEYWICEHSNGPKPNRCSICDSAAEPSEIPTFVNVTLFDKAEGEQIETPADLSCTLREGHPRLRRDDEAAESKAHFKRLEDVQPELYWKHDAHSASEPKAGSPLLLSGFAGYELHTPVPENRNKTALYAAELLKTARARDDADRDAERADEPAAPQGPAQAQWLRCHEGPHVEFNIISGVLEYDDGVKRAASSAEIHLWVWIEWATNEFKKLRTARTTEQIPDVLVSAQNEHGWLCWCSTWNSPDIAECTNSKNHPAQRTAEKS